MEFIDHILVTARDRDAHCKRITDQYALRPSDLDVLVFLALHPERCTAKDICEERLLAKSLVSAAVDTLVSRGLLARETDPVDRRRTLLTLQPAADEIIECIRRETQGYIDRLCAGISDGDIAIFQRVLRQMRHNMNEINAGE